MLGAGYPSPTRMLTHLEQVLERYLVDGRPARRPGRPGGSRSSAPRAGRRPWPTCSARCGRTTSSAPGDKIAIATPIFTPYLQIPVLEDFGFEVVELGVGPQRADRFDDERARPAARPGDQGVLPRQPGQPRQPRPPPGDADRSCATSCANRAPGPDRSWPTRCTPRSSRGSASLMADIPRNVICLHSFSKNFGATGARLGFVAVHEDNVLDDLLAGQAADVRASASRTATARSRRTSATLPFMSRLVADSREVALHNIAGLATPGPGADGAVRAGLPAAAAGRGTSSATRAELAARLDALLGPARRPGSGRPGQHVLRAGRRARRWPRRSTGAEFAAWLRDNVEPEDVAVAPGRGARRRRAARRDLRLGQLGRPRVPGLPHRPRLTAVGQSIATVLADIAAPPDSDAPRSRPAGLELRRTRRFTRGSGPAAPRGGLRSAVPAGVERHADAGRLLGRQLHGVAHRVGQLEGQVAVEHVAAASARCCSCSTPLRNVLENFIGLLVDRLPRRVALGPGPTSGQRTPSRPTRRSVAAISASARPWSLPLSSSPWRTARRISLRST